MNFLMMSKTCFKFTFTTLRRRNYCEKLIFSQKHRDIRLTEIQIINNITKVFSSDNVKSESFENILRSIRYDMGRYSNNLTKKLFDHVWLQVEHKNFPININHINFTMEGLIGNRIYFNPEEILKKIKDNNLSLNNVTLDLLLKGSCLAGDLDSATKLIDKMTKVNIYLNATKYSWLIGCAIRAGNKEKEDEFFQKIETEGLQLTNSAYTFIASAYASKLDVDNCVRILGLVNNKVEYNNNMPINKYDSYIELVKNNASEDLLVKFITFLNNDEDYKVLLDTISQLNRINLFDGSMLLLKHTTLSLDHFQWKILLLRFLSVNTPRKHIKTLMSKVEQDISLMIYTLRFIRPIDDAIKFAENYLTYDRFPINENIASNLLINGLLEKDKFSTSKKLLRFIQSRICCDDYYTILVTRVIDLLLDHEPEGYTSLLARYAPSIANENDTNFIFSCVVHCLIMKGPKEATELYKTYLVNDNCQISLRFKNLTYFLFKQKNIDEICEIILAMESFLPQIQYIRFIEDVLNGIIRLQKVDEFEILLKVILEKTDFRKFPKSLSNLKMNKKCSDYTIEIINKYSESDNITV